MRWKLAIAAGIAALSLSAPAARADENDKLTFLTFSKPVQLPGVTLPAGRYRFELADPVDDRRVVKVQSEDGHQQLAMLLSIQNQLREPARDPVVLFMETPEGQPEAVKAWIYPGDTIGYEFIYPKEQALKIARQSRSSVLSKDGDAIYRINERGERVPEDK